MKFEILNSCLPAGTGKFPKKILFCGGGTTGHVTKNKILLEALCARKPDIERHYMGLKRGKESELIDAELAQFHPISSGKLRRYFSLRTVPDFFRFLWGIAQAYKKLGEINPNLVFSSGGFVALPVAIASKWRGIPILSHETDSYPGLSNRIIANRADKILLGYASANKYFKKKNTIFVGNPVSPKLFKGSKNRALKQLGFDPKRKTLLVMGGSQGAKQINELIWKILPELVENNWQIIHLTGAGKGLSSKTPNIQSSREKEGKYYRAFEYATREYADFLSASDLVISRGGGNSLAEIEALGKPAIVIPLSSSIAAGDHQRKNAEEMAQKHKNWTVLGNPTSQELLQLIKKIHLNQENAPNKNSESPESRILDLIYDYF